MTTPTAPARRRSRARLPRGVVRRVRADGREVFKAWVGSGANGGKTWGEDCRTIDDAEDDRRRMLKLRKTPELPAVTVKAMLDLTAEELRRTRREGTSRWFKNHRGVIERDFGAGEDVAKIRRRDVERARDKWVDTDKVSTTTVLHRRSCLSRALSTVADRLTNGSPMVGVRWPEARRKKRASFRPDEVAAIVQAIREEGEDGDADVVAFLAASGLRRGELSRLRVEDVDLQRGSIEIDGKKRNEPLHLVPAALVPLRALMARAKQGDPIVGNFDRVDYVFRRTRALPGVAKVLGKRAWTPHALRHAFVSALVAGGLDVAQVQRFARIESIKILETYVHAIRRQEDQLADVERALSAPAPKPQAAAKAE